MRICVVGAGYVGLVTAAVIAGLGYQVSVVENQPAKLAVLRKGETPIYEEGLPNLVKDNFRDGRLAFTDDIGAAAEKAEAVFIAVGTPSQADGSPDMTSFYAVRDALCQLPHRSSTGRRLAVVKSTVPIGTGDALHHFFQKNAASRSWQVVSNPEFLRQGTALYDTNHADRIIIGAEEEDAAHLLMKIYAPLSRPVLLVDRRSAEMIKYAANTFLAAKISFINEMACLCEQVGADIGAVARGMGMDARIGHAFLKAGIGFGGSCFPKDLHALLSTGQETQLQLPMITAVAAVNHNQNLLLPRFLGELYGDLQGVRVCLWGLTYKPGTDDTRDAPALAVLTELIGRGAQVTAYDPQLKACWLVKQQFPAVSIAHDPYEAAARSEAILLLTEWPEFAHLNWNRLRHQVKRPLVLDGRNHLEGSVIEAAGFSYAGIGQKRYPLKRLKTRVGSAEVGVASL